MTINSIAHYLPLLLGKEMGGGGHEGMTGIKAIVKGKNRQWPGCTAWCGMVWYSMAWRGMVLQGTVWYSSLCTVM